MPLPQSFANASAAVGDDLATLTKRLESLPGKCATLNDLHDWWTKELKLELRDLKDTVKFMLDHGFATARNIANTKLLTLRDFTKPEPAVAAPKPPEPKPAPPPTPKLAAKPPAPPEASFDKPVAEPAAPEEKWLTPKETKTILGVTDTTLSGYARAKKIVCKNVGKGTKNARWMFQEASVLARLKHNQEDVKFAQGKRGGELATVKRDEVKREPEKPKEKSVAQQLKVADGLGLELRMFLTEQQQAILQRLADTGLFGGNRTEVARNLLASKLRRLRNFAK